MQDTPYRAVPLFRRGGELAGQALVDEIDLARVAPLRWSLSSHGYVVTNLPRSQNQGKHRTMYMHRFILGLERGDRKAVDHINRDKLDNRRANLRLGGQALNAQNVLRHSGTSRFRGVAWNTQQGKWKATCIVDKRIQHIGFFESEVAAAIAAEAYRSEHMPWAEPDPELRRAIGVTPIQVQRAVEAWDPTISDLTVRVERMLKAALEAA